MWKPKTQGSGVYYQHYDTSRPYESRIPQLFCNVKGLCLWNDFTDQSTYPATHQVRYIVAASLAQHRMRDSPRIGHARGIGLPYFCDFKAGRLQRPRPLSCDFLTLNFPILLHRPTFKAIPAVFIDRIVIESS